MCSGVLVSSKQSNGLLFLAFLEESISFSLCPDSLLIYKGNTFEEVEEL